MIDLKRWALPLGVIVLFLFIGGFLAAIAQVPIHGEDYRKFVCAHPPLTSPNADLVNQLVACVPATMAIGFPIVDRYYENYLLPTHSWIALGFSSGWDASRCQFNNEARNPTFAPEVEYASVFEAGKKINGVADYYSCVPQQITDAYCKAIDPNSELVGMYCECKASFELSGGKCVRCAAGFEPSGGTCVPFGTGAKCTSNGICEAGCGLSDPDCGGAVTTPSPSVTSSATPLVLTPSVTPSVAPSPSAGGEVLPAGVDWGLIGFLAVLVLAGFAALKFGLIKL